jgi:Asp-tRNA(Asn)/Glu-tRNA(Gln) amidotransferase A subunit family amidase
MTITDAAGFIRRGELTPSELLEQCLARIDRYEDRVRAWVYLDRDGAREQAARLTTELKQNNYRGPLHGIPIGIKDIIDVFDMPTGCGSKLWANSYARRDATVVERLRQAGAVVMGKTVTTAYASFDPPVTRNPWNLERTPGGSSSGSAAAVACGMCLGALATQTGGSITRPASYCGVSSIKPTHGRVNVNGVMPLAPSMDHVGAMANCVRDLAILFETIAGPRGDPDHWFQNSYQLIPDCVSGTSRGYGAPKLPITRLGGLFDEAAKPDLFTAYNESLRKLEAEWTTLERNVLPGNFVDQPAAHRLVMAVEAATYHEKRLARHPDDYPPRIRELIEEGIASRGTAYSMALGFQDELQRVASSMLGRGNRRVIAVTPAAASFAPPADTTGNPIFNTPWSFTRLPTISIPVGWSGDGLPCAIQLIGDHGEEADLFAVAAWCQETIGFERRPLPL